MSRSQNPAAAAAAPVFYVLDLYTGDEHIPWTAGRSLPDSIAEAWPFRYPPISIRQHWGEPTRITKNLFLDHTPESLASEFPGLLPTGQYEAQETVMGINWQEHVFETRGLLLRLVDMKYANSFGLQVALGVICQGLPSVFAMEQPITLPDGLVATVWANGSGEHADHRLEPTDELVNADLPSPGATDRIRQQIYGRRFIATFFNFGNKHWVAAVFDQVGGMLYLYDTIEANRGKRAKAAGLAWRSFGLNLGMPCTIRVISPPLPQQPNDWACGYIGLINILLSVRCLEGLKYHDLYNRDSRRFLAADGREARQILTLNVTPELPIPDWRCGANNSKDGWRRAATVVRAILFNELGIRSTAHFRERVRGDTPRNYHEFGFVNGFPGAITGLVIPDASDWATQPTLYAPLYSGRGPMMSGIDGRLRGPEPAPAGWPPHRDVIFRHYPASTGPISDLVRERVRCWNRSSPHFSLDNLTRPPANMGDAMTVSSGTRVGGRGFDAITISSGGGKHVRAACKLYVVFIISQR